MCQNPAPPVLSSVPILLRWFAVQPGNAWRRLAGCRAPSDRDRPPRVSSAAGGGGDLNFGDRDHARIMQCEGGRMYRGIDAGHRARYVGQE
jgi:hypothetical protein